jgi:hypothetical protein
MATSLLGRLGQHLWGAAGMRESPVFVALFSVATMFPSWPQLAPRRVKLKTEVPHVALVGPSKVYVPSGK